MVGPQHGAYDQAAELSRLLGQGQLLGQGRAPHVVGQEGTREHGRIGPQGLVERHHHRPEQVGQHRGQTDDADHGQGQGAHSHDTLLKFLPQAEPIAQDAVKRTQGHKDDHEVDNNLVDGHSMSPFRGSGGRLGRQPERMTAAHMRRPCFSSSRPVCPQWRHQWGAPPPPLPGPRRRWPRGRSLPPRPPRSRRTPAGAHPPARSETPAR